MYKSIKPLGPRLIVLPLPPKEEKSGDIIIPGIAIANLEYGKVLEAADEFSHLVKKGDTVIYPSGSGQGLRYQNQGCLFLTMNDLWGSEVKTLAFGQDKGENL